MAKIKQDNNFSRKYAPLVLWYEDVEEIFDTLSNSAKSIKLSNGTYEFDNLSETRDHCSNEPQNKFKVSASEPYTRFEGDRMGASLYVSGNEKSAHVYFEINNVLTRAQRKPTILYRSWLVTVVILLLGAVPRVIQDPIWSQIILPMQIAAFAWFLWIMFLGLRRATVVHLVRRSEGKGFFERNKDQLLMMIIGIIVGGLLTFAGTQIRDIYFPPTATHAK